MTLTPDDSSDHWVPTGDGHELYVRRVVPAGVPGAAAGTPAVLFLAGLFSDQGFFLDPKGRGPARAFLDEGFTCLLADLRGHGHSRRQGPPAFDWTFDSYVWHDIPALLSWAQEQHRGPLFILAHSMAGYAVLAALGAAPGLQAGLTGVVTLASAVNDYSDGGAAKRLNLVSAVLLSRLLGRFPARALRLGRWDEPPGLMKQFARWAPCGDFSSEDGAVDYWTALRQVKVPVLLGIGAADTFHASPARTRKLASHLGGPAEVVVLGRGSGLDWDPGHIDVVRGSRAQTQVLPQTIAWMRHIGTGPNATETP